MIWTDSEITRLRQLWADGRTASQIAAELGTTRNAVLGKLFRLREPYNQWKWRKQRERYVAQQTAVTQRGETA